MNYENIFILIIKKKIKIINLLLNLLYKIKDFQIDFLQ